MIPSINLITSANCVEWKQVRFPRSKKKRIQAKWAKRRRNFLEIPRMFRMPDNTILCHPSIAARLRAEIQRTVNLQDEWEQARADGIDRCGAHQLKDGANRRCFRPAGHAGEHLF